MVGVEHHLGIAVIGSHVDIVEGRLQFIWSGVVDSLHGHIVSLLEVALCIGSVAAALRIGRNLVGILQPPGICKISLGEIETCKVLGSRTGETRIVGQVGNSLLQVGEDTFLIHLLHRVAHGGSDGGSVELQFAGTQVEGHAAVGLNKDKIVESAEEVSLSQECVADACCGTVLDDTACGVDVGKGSAPASAGHATARCEIAHAREVGLLEVAVGRLRISILISTRLEAVEIIAVAIEIAQVCIERGKTSLDTRLRGEESGVELAARLLVEHIGARGHRSREATTNQSRSKNIFYTFGHHNSEILNIVPLVRM